MSRDNWERLVSAVVKREQIRQLCYQDSVTTISSDFSQQILDLEDVSVTSPPPIPPENSSSVSEGSSSSYSPEESLRTRSLDLYGGKTSFRVDGTEEFDIICKTFGFSGIDDFTITAEEYEAMKKTLLFFPLSGPSPLLCSSVYPVSTRRRLLALPPNTAPLFLRCQHDDDDGAPNSGDAVPDILFKDDDSEYDDSHVNRDMSIKLEQTQIQLKQTKRELEDTRRERDEIRMKLKQYQEEVKKT